jgi:hypothetical protein
VYAATVAIRRAALSLPVIVLLASLTACGGGPEDASGDCTVELVFDEQSYLGQGSATTEVREDKLGTGELLPCDDNGDSTSPGAAGQPVAVWSVADQAAHDVVGVEVEGRLDLYFDDSMSRAEIDRALEELS